MKNILKSLLLLLLISCGSSSQYWEEYKFEDHVDIVDLIMSYKEQNPEYEAFAMDKSLGYIKRECEILSNYPAQKERVLELKKEIEDYSAGSDKTFDETTSEGSKKVSIYLPKINYVVNLKTKGEKNVLYIYSYIEVGDNFKINNGKKYVGFYVNYSGNSSQSFFANYKHYNNSKYFGEEAKEMRKVRKELEAFFEKLSVKWEKN